MASRWHKIGWEWLQYAFLTQIDADGTYIQHSTNYHRLMLQSAIWAVAVQQHSFKLETLSSKAFVNLIHSTSWLLLMLDPQTGRVPNLGHNDGSYILPLTVCPWHDYRPVIHAAARLFWQVNLLPHGPWQDMSCWLGLSDQPIKGQQSIDSYQASYQKENARHEIPINSPYVLVNQTGGSWAVLQAAQFHSRPAHADQLHLDLWRHGQNIALDPGTYLYNSPPPWDNSLTSAMVHNTVTVDDQEYLLRAGRFLYLDRSQAKVLASHYDPESKSHTLTASHAGYRKLGITHIRTVTTFQDGHWEVEDSLEGSTGQAHSLRLHWLLPDWEYELYDTSQDARFPGYKLTLRSAGCKVTLHSGVMQPDVGNQKTSALEFQLARAGELLVGTGTVPPIAGYYSPTYGVKIPALAYILKVKGYLPIRLKSYWTLPRARAAVIIIKNDKIALLERRRAGKHYFVIPGGKLEPGETPEMAAAREAKEELGLEVKIGRRVAEVWYQGRPQYFFLAEETGGVFGQMSGPEAGSLPGSQKGSYLPSWVNVSELPGLPVLPQLIANLVLNSHRAGWPADPLYVPELPPDEV
jgi:8-oxo-dGTP pyrophosphatase MutT (NUDIX family)